MTIYGQLAARRVSTGLIAMLALSSCDRPMQLQYPSIEADPIFEQIEPNVFALVDLPPPNEDAELIERDKAALKAALDHAKLPRQAFNGYNYDFSVFGYNSWHQFATVPQPTDYPGLCKSTIITVNKTPDEKIDKVVTNDNYYGIVGNVAPRSKPSPVIYDEAFKKACNSRTDQYAWMTAANAKEAVIKARLASLIISNAQRDGMLPFSLTCTPYPIDTTEKPLCVGQARYALASIDASALTFEKDLEACSDEKEKSVPNCYILTFDRAPMKQLAGKCV